ncbi:hypothetical protein [Flavobacterium aestivum]|uniref:hypothetical protein n=1 Tax=Flavobacterium aestivum TaxID=3003257 RepID=UPI0024831B00|nr:hypothetical protein [Flavobacterium aestivum]
MENIRFFYSNREALISFQNEIKGSDTIEKLKKEIQLKFCLDYSFQNLKTISLEYFSLYVDKIIKNKEEETFEYCDLLDSIFYLFITNCNFKENDIKDKFELLRAHINFDKQSKIEIEDELLNYSKTYISLIIQKVLFGEINDPIINENSELLGYDEFNAPPTKHDAMLYEVIKMDLASINRMKNLYKKNPLTEPVGFQDFSNMFSTLGKIEFWKKLDTNLDKNIIDQLFINEFGKSLNYFSF